MMNQKIKEIANILGQETTGLSSLEKVLKVFSLTPAVLKKGLTFVAGVSAVTTVTSGFDLEPIVLLILSMIGIHFVKKLDAKFKKDIGEAEKFLDASTEKEKE